MDKSLNHLHSTLYLAASICILVLIKVIIFPDCYSFDTHDEANHAFPSLLIARQMILSGILPSINYFNNFGLPLLGDGLTYPLGIQTLSYYFLEPHLAMTVNRGLVAVSTTIVFYFFFKLFLENSTSLICAFLAVFTPIAFWYPVHHYQLASLFAFLLLLASYYFFKTPTFKILLVCTGLWALMVLSVSINHIVLFLPFWIVWSVVRSNFVLGRKFLAIQCSMLAGLILTLIQTYEFVLNFSRSARVSEGVYDSVLTNWRELFLGMVIPPGEWLSYNYGAQLQVATYVSLPLLILIIFGMFVAIKGKSAEYGWPVFLCGVVPTLAALLLYILPEIRLRVPVVKTGDITRVLWFSMPFCMIAVGFSVEALQRNVVSIRLLMSMLVTTFAGLIFFWMAPELDNLTIFHVLVVIIFLFALFFILLARVTDGSRFEKSYFFVGTTALLVSLILVTLPTTSRILGLNTGYCGGTQYSARTWLSDFYPVGLLDKLDKNSRVAAEIVTYKGHDLRLGNHGLLGSGCRSLICDKDFGEILENLDLVTIDQVPYGYFFSRPWNTEKLSEFGIRYLFINRDRDDELGDLGWARVAVAGDYSVYENPQKPTPVYLKDNSSQEIIFLEDFVITGNAIKVEVTQKERGLSNLVVTMTYREGFEAFVDGENVNIQRNDNGFLEMEMPMNARSVEVFYRPYSPTLFLVTFLLSGLLLAVAKILVAKTQAKIRDPDYVENRV